MKRKNYSKREIVAHWEAAEGRCWRCGLKIIHAVYGVGWVLGHIGKAHWAGGMKVAPEHTACNSEDGKQQTKLAAKSVRVRARDIGVKKPSRLAQEYARVKEHYHFDWRTQRWVPKT